MSDLRAWWDLERDVYEAEPDEKKFSLGSYVLQCPSCRVVGFYAPQRSPPELEKEISRKYFACKFCAVWREVWGTGVSKRGSDKYICTHVICTECGRHDWRTPDDPFRGCKFCLSGKGVLVIDSAFKNKKHPYEKQIKNEIALDKKQLRDRGLLDRAESLMSKLSMSDS